MKTKEQRLQELKYMSNERHTAIYKRLTGQDPPVGAILKDLILSLEFPQTDGDTPGSGPCTQRP